MTTSSEGAGLLQSKAMTTVADGRYELIKEVGEGAYGRVLLSREVEETELSDETVIGEVAWKTIKTEALNGNHKSQKWYIEAQKDEKYIADRLVKAQNAQGNLEPLKPERFNMDVAIKVVNKDQIQKYNKIQSVFREKDLLYDLEHHFIIKLFDTSMVSLTLLIFITCRTLQTYTSFSKCVRMEICLH